MSQAALNKRDPENKEKHSLRKNNRMRFVGMIFLFSVICTLIISVCTVLRWMEDIQKLPLSKLVITGERHYTRNDDIRHSIVALLGVSNTFIKQDVSVIQREIKRIPWIKQVSVRKQWPDKLKIHLVEYVPIAQWNDHYMLDVEGHSFIIPIDRMSQQNLPMLHGPEGSEKEVLQNFQTMRQILSKNNCKLKEAIMTTRHSWKLTLMNGIKLNLGRGEIMKRLIRFMEIYPLLLQQAQTLGKQINYIDLRYDSGLSVAWS